MNANELKGRIIAKGYSIESFCAEAGFSRSTFDRKLKGKAEFNRDEMEKIIILLTLDAEETRNIFFGKKVA